MKRRFLTLIFTITAMLICMLGFVACGETVDNFNLSFKVDGETYQTLTTNGEETIQIPDNPTKEGYQFEGWYWDNGEWERPFTANSLLDEPISSDMSVYAKFSAIEYDITYENNGGTHNNPVSYTIEGSFVLSDAEKIGYDFVGWYSEDSYTTKVVSISAGSTGEITLYAKYEVINYTITYENTKETEKDNASLYTIESQTIVLADLEKSGYIFDGWYNGETKITEIITGSIGNLTLTAHWTPISYSISYENTKGTSNNNETSYTIESEKITLKNLNKTGYTFDGWYNGETKVTEIATGSTGNLTLSAQWKPIVYSISYNNTKDVLNNNPTSYTIESEMITLIGLEKNGYKFDGWYNNGRKETEIQKGSIGNLTFTAKWTPTSYEIKYHNVTGATNNNPTMYDVEDQPLVLSAANKVGYTFTGWYTDSACQNKINEIAVGTIGEINLYAGWEIIEYTATFKNGNTPIDEITFTVETQSIEEPAVPNYVGYTGKWSDYELGASHITINAVYTPIVYSITYENKKDAINDNAANYTIESETITLIDLERNGYEFDGWYNNGTKVTEIATGSTGNLVLTAQWTPIEYSITYMYDSAIGDYVDNNKNPSTYTIEDEFNFVSLVNKTVGYTFDGWYTEKNVGTGEKVSGIVLGRTGDIIVYAHWALEVYTITYHNVEGLTNTNPTTYTVETDTFEVSDISKTGYTFDGWFADEALTQLADISIEKGNTGNIVLYAKFTVIEYAIEYVLYGGTIEDGPNPSIYTVEDEIDLIEPILSGYEFDNWRLSNINGEIITKIEKGTTGNLTLHATYLYISTITFETNGGGVVSSIKKVEGSKITLPSLSKDWYTFGGWYSDSSLKNRYTSTIQPDADITLYAKWIDNAEYLVYELQSDNTYAVAGYTEQKTKIKIYSTYKGKTVTKLLNTALNDCTSLTDLIIPDSVKTIEKGALTGCGKLRSLKIPFVGGKFTTENITSSFPQSNVLGYIFGTTAYNGAIKIDQHYGPAVASHSYFYIPSSLQTLIITGGYIQYGGCGYITSLINVTIEENVLGIGTQAFGKCTSLKEVSINCSNVNNGNSSFSGCSNLVNIKLGKSFKSIGGYMFANCTALKEITISENVTNIDSYAFEGCNNLIEVKLPDSVESIGSYAFYECTELKTINFGGNLTYIGTRAFWKCTKLEKAIFARTDKWFAAMNANGVSAGKISEDALSDPSLAAQWLIDHNGVGGRYMLWDL